MLIQKLLRDVVDAAVGQPLGIECVDDLLELLGRRPFADRIVDGARMALIDHQPIAGFDEFEAVGLLVHEKIRETAFAALAGEHGQFFIKKFPVLKSDRTQGAEVDFHSTSSKYCLPGASRRFLWPPR